MLSTQWLVMILLLLLMLIIVFLFLMLRRSIVGFQEGYKRGRL